MFGLEEGAGVLDGFAHDSDLRGVDDIEGVQIRLRG
jgi:hypothetical protein